MMLGLQKDVNFRSVSAFETEHSNTPSVCIVGNGKLHRDSFSNHTATGKNKNTGQSNV